MSKELYLVTFDGYCDQYGSEIYLGGIFDSRDKADEYIESQIYLANMSPEITVIRVNRGYECKYADLDHYDHSVSTDIYLGGYVE